MRRTTVTLLLLALSLLPPMARGAQEQQLIVEDLACRGNVSTSCTFILGQLYLSPGDTLDEEEIENAKLRLSALRNFTSVSIYLEKGSARGRARVIVEVVEASPIDTELSLEIAGSDINTLQGLFGRLTYNNLFGAGKILDLRASESSPLNDAELQDDARFARVAYVDPHLFDSKRNYMTFGTSYVERHYDRRNGDFADIRLLGVDLTFGRRLFDFSYFSLGYQYRPIREQTYRVTGRHGQVFEGTDGIRSGALFYTYGWNTEDDPYFPTRGSRAQVLLIAAGGESEDLDALYGRTWTWGRSILSFQFRDIDTFSLGFARPLAPEGLFRDIRRGRWFVGFNTALTGYTAEGERIQAVSLQTGVLLETRRFGIVRFTVSGVTDFDR